MTENDRLKVTITAGRSNQSAPVIVNNAVRIDPGPGHSETFQLHGPEPKIEADYSDSDDIIYVTLQGDLIEKEYFRKGICACITPGHHVSFIVAASMHLTVQSGAWELWGPPETP